MLSNPQLLCFLVQNGYVVELCCNLLLVFLLSPCLGSYPTDFKTSSESIVLRLNAAFNPWQQLLLKSIQKV